MSDTPAIIASGLPGKREEAQRAGITIAAFMTGVDSNGIAHDDLVLMRRLSLALLAIFLFTLAFHRLNLMYSQKFFAVTGDAEWIWAHHPLSRGMPLAFFATRDFDIPPDRYFTKIKIAADPEYALYFNGRLIGAKREQNGDRLDVYDVSDLARTGRNRIVVAARSATGVGGVIAAIDTRPDFHLLATNSDWKIVRKWTDDLPLVDPPAIETAIPLLLGRPPMRRWNYLKERQAQFLTPPTRVVVPARSFPVAAALPDINVIGGVAVAGSHPMAAVAYDFGFIDGHVQLITPPRPAGSQVIRVRRAYSESDLPPAEGLIDAYVIAPGERSITDPQVHNFRYVMVYGGKAEARAAQ